MRGRNSAFCSGVAGMLGVAYFGSAQQNEFDTYLLDSISAVVVGGTSLFGGQGGIGNTIIGLVVLGVPSNDFGAQEPKTEPEIAKFCETSFGVSFPMTAKQKVAGVDAHGLYQWIAGEAGEAVMPKWNFHKFLIDKDGKLAGSWPSRVEPTSAEITSAIEDAL